MTKVEDLKSKLEPILNEALTKSSYIDLFNFLEENSSLPGRRANLELATAFIELGQILSEQEEGFLELVRTMLSFDEIRAPTNDPKEFIAFCGTKALGIEKVYRALGSDKFTEVADDNRWRIREAVAMVIQMLIPIENVNLVEVFDEWVESENNLLLRAIVTGYAEPSILDNNEVIKEAFKYTEIILRKIEQNTIPTEDIDVLVKGLSYVLSVYVSSDPERGFPFLKSWVGAKNKLIMKVIKDNLTKNRLKRKYAGETSEILDLINTTEH